MKQRHDNFIREMKGLKPCRMRQTSLESAKKDYKEICRKFTEIFGRPYPEILK